MSNVFLDCQPPEAPKLIIDIRLPLNYNIKEMNTIVF